jgi:hypothetical protein
MAVFLGFDPSKENEMKAVLALEPKRRALFERMADLTMEVNLWSEGLGPKPEGVLIDGPNDPWMRKYIDKA